MTGIQHTERRKYTQAAGTAYSLPHDEDERSRLALQSNLLLRTYDSKVLHAPVELKDQDWVLEMGTGTGIWLQDLLKEISTNARCIGIDLESSLFPSPSTLPPNLAFKRHSVINLPREWINKFTVVHQRLLIAGLRRQEWEQAIREMYRVLKPGGWLQLLEMKIWVAGPALAKHRELLYKFSDDQGTMWRDITARIPEFLRQSGFVNVRCDTRQTPLGSWAGKDGIDGSENLMGIMRGLKTPILKGGGYGIVKTEADYDELVEQVRVEMDNTSGSRTAWSMFLAQKPEKSHL